MKIRWKVIVTTLVVSLLAACATPQPSQLMTNVENELESPQRDALETQFPQLIAQAEDALKKGRKALEEGDSNRSELYASIANSKYQAAVNLSKASELGNEQAAYEDALASLEEEVEFLAREAEELERFNQLKDRFQQATGKLEQYEGMEGDARQSLALARKKQGEALREGAPQFAAKAYQEGEILTQSALAALERDDFQTTIELSGEAVGVFEDAIAESKDSAVAQRRRAEESEEQQQTRSKQRNETLDAIEEAVEMKAAAIADGADKRQPNLFQKGDFLLERAELAVDDGRFEQASESAQKATKSFEEAIKVETEEEASAKKAPETAPRPARMEAAVSQQALAPRPREQRSSASRAEVVELITKTQMQRAEALGRGDDDICPNAFQEFEAVLDIAQQRLASGDYASAFEHAIRAQERLRLCKSGDSEVSQSMQTERSARDARDETSATTTARRAQASSQAREVAITAAEKADTAEEEELSPLERAARERAISAMTEADLAIARAEFRGAPRSRISRAGSLNDSAKKSFDNKDYAQATLFADLAVEELTPKAETAKKEKTTGEDDTQRADEKRAAAKEAAEKEAAEKEAAEKEAAKKAAGSGAQAQAQSQSQPQPQEACPENKALASFVEQRVRDEGVIQRSRGNSSWTPPTSLRAARTLDKEGKCDAAREFYQQAVSEVLDERKATSTASQTGESKESTEEAAQTQTTERSRTATATQQSQTGPKPKVSKEANEALRQSALTSVAEAQRKLASLGGKSNAPAMKMSSRLVKRSEDAFDSKRYEDAYVLSQQALGAMEAVSSQQTGESGTTKSTAEWKGAYQTVLDALIARDRAKSLVGEDTNDLFERGVNFLGKARDAWSAKDYRAAEKYAAAASEDFEEVQANAKDAQKKAAEEKKREEQEEAQREKEAQKKAEAEKTEREKRAEREAAERDKKARAEARSDASSALREASVKFELCEERNCRERDSRAFLTGTELLEDAREAMKAENYDQAARLGKEAGAKFQGVLDQPMELSRATSEQLTVEDGEIKLSPRIKFDLGSTTVSQASMPSLRALADYLEENEAVLEEVSIVGHTDSKGNAENNKELSQKRAQSVADSLRAMGVDASLLSVIGMGESQPIATNDTAEGRAKNRRVEIRYELRSE